MYNSSQRKNFNVSIYPFSVHIMNVTWMVHGVVQVKLCCQSSQYKGQTLLRYDDKVSCIS